MRHTVTLIAMLGAALATGCAEEVPDAPTWTEDVRPIINANCIRCHSAPPIEDAPTAVRFDKYDGEDRDGDGDVSNSCGAPDVCGAATPLASSTMALDIAQRISLDEDDPMHMPPGFTLPDRMIDTISAWAESGAPEGEPLPGNVEPTMVLTTDFEKDGDTLLADYRIDDPDFDVVTGRLVAERDVLGEPFVVTWELFAGDGRIAWDVSDVPPGTYELSAVIHDGSAEVTVDLDSVEVP